MTTPLKRRQWVGVDYVTERTGYARYTVYRMAREGRLPAYRNGRSIRFDPDEIDRWMAKMPKASA